MAGGIGNLPMEDAFMKIKLLLAGIIFSLSQIAHASYDMHSINLPDEAKAQIDTKQTIADINEKKKKGYLERISDKYEYLNNIQNRIQYESQANIKSTKIRKKISDVMTSSKLKSVPSHVKTATLGYAPVGTFNQGFGWTGITEIFKSKDAGICQFSHFDLKASNGGYSLSEKDERRDVNGKYTFVEVTGKMNQGFDYEVDWFEELNMYTLNCINKKFSSNFMHHVINLAKKIDKG